MKNELTEAKKYAKYWRFIINLTMIGAFVTLVLCWWSAPHALQKLAELWFYLLIFQFGIWVGIKYTIKMVLEKEKKHYAKIEGETVEL